MNAMLNVGISYWKGACVAVDRVEAFKWLDLARFYTRERYRNMFIVSSRFSKYLVALAPLAFGSTCWSAAPEVLPPPCRSPAPLEGHWYEQAPGYIVMLTKAEEAASVTAARLAQKYGFTVESAMERLRMFTVTRFDPAALAKMRCDVSVKLVAFNEPTQIATASQEWSLQPSGAGPLRIGMSLREVSTVLAETVEVPSDPDEQSCFYVEPKAQPHLALMMVGGALARVDILDSSLRTSTGIAIGDPVARVKETYGSALDIQPHFYVAGEQNLTAFADGKQYAVRFETDNGKVSAIYAGLYDQVKYVEGCL